MSQPPHDSLLDVLGNETTPSRRSTAGAAEVQRTVPTQRQGEEAAQGTTEGTPSATGRTATVACAAPHLAGVEDLADLSGRAEAVALAGIGGLAAAPVTDEQAGPVAVAEPQAAPDGELPTSVTDGRGRHRAPVIGRRPAAYLAAVLTGTLGLGLLGGSETAAQADAPQPVRVSVSVAEELGLDGGDQRLIAEADATLQLREMAASRVAREAEQTAAAAAQSEADRLAAEAIAEAARPDAVLPVQGARLTSGFGARWGTLHAGIDLAAPMHTPEYAAMDGVVLEAGPASGYGLVVYIQHPNGDVTVYGHMDQILVEPGQVVRAGDTIALLGNRGQSTGPHLHFEVHVGGLDGQKIDPIPWLREKGVQI